MSMGKGQGPWTHRNLGVEDGTMLCANCGPVPASFKNGRAVCSVARAARRGHKPGRAYRLASSCAVCGSTQRLCVDHDHACCPRKVRGGCDSCRRGVLCQTCNVTLGMIETAQAAGTFEALLAYAIRER